MELALQAVRGTGPCQIPVTAKLEAQQVKAELIKACRFGDFSGFPFCKEDGGEAV